MEKPRQGPHGEADRAQLRPRCDGRAAMADAIMALTANIAMSRQERIAFDRRWYDAATQDVPEQINDRPRR